LEEDLETEVAEVGTLVRLSPTEREGAADGRGVMIVEASFSSSMV
jgi:hypothetical protein